MFPKPKPLSVVVVVAIVVLTLVPLALRPLLNLNEGLYAEVAREMLAHHPLMPQLDGLPYLEKPPMLYWLIMLSYKIFGIGKFAARLPSALAALATLSIVWRFAKNRSLVPAWPALILFSSIGFYIMSQLAMFDMTFTLFHTITLLAFFSYLEKPERSGRLMLSAVASALAVLTKGLMGLALPGLIVLFFLLIERRTLPWRPFMKAWLVFFAIVLPWHIWMAMHVPHFFNRYIVQEQFGRYLGTLKPMDYRRPPFYYDFEHLLIGIFPWIPFFFAALIHRRPFDRLDRFLLLWASVYVIFFTLSQTSSSYYMLPAFPAVALFMGRALPTLHHKPPLAWFLNITALLCIAAAIFAIHMPHPFMRPYVAAMAAIYLGFFLTALQRHRPRFERFLTFAAIGSLGGFVILFLILAKTHGDRYASKGLAMSLRPDLTPHAYVFVAQRYEDLSSFDFYLHRKIYVFNRSQGDLYYGIKQDPKNRTLISGQAFVRFVRHHRVFIAGPRARMASWRRYGVFHIVASNSHDVVVENDWTKGRSLISRPLAYSLNRRRDAASHQG